MSKTLIVYYKILIRKKKGGSYNEQNIDRLLFKKR